MGVNKYAVIGLGQFGMAIARTLSERGAEVLAIDIDSKRTDIIKDQVAYAVTLDCTDNKSLEAQNLGEMDAAVVAIGENFEALILTSVYLKELKIGRIIARANGPRQRKILNQIGIHEILSPEDEVGISVAERLINPSILSSLQLQNDYEIVEVSAPSSLLGRTLEEIGLRRKYQLTVVTIKRQFEMDADSSQEQVLGVPNPETIIQRGDSLIVFGKSSAIAKFIDIN